MAEMELPTREELDAAITEEVVSPHVQTTALIDAMLDAIYARLAVAQVERTVNGVTWLLFENGHVLMERCPNKAAMLGVGEQWFIPGGKLERGETPEAALRREIAEEWPGVELLTFLPLPIVEGSAVPPGPKGVFLMRPYLITVRGEVASISGDGIPLSWRSVAEALASPVAQVRMMVAAAGSIHASAERD